MASLCVFLIRIFLYSGFQLDAIGSELLKLGWAGMLIPLILYWTKRENRYSY